MYTKNQFNKLLKTRKHWTGQQIGRMLVQATIQQMNGTQPFVNSEKDLAPLVNQLADPKDINDYNVYAKLSSGFIGAWNYIEALGNDARASLSFLQLLIQNLTDWTHAELNNQYQPVIVTQKQYDNYKKKFDAIVAEDYRKAGHTKASLAEILFYSTQPNEYFSAPGGGFYIRHFGKNATKVINKYKNIPFTTSDISFLRDFIQEQHLLTPKLDKLNKLDVDLIAGNVNLIEGFAQFPHSRQLHKYLSSSNDISSFLVKHYRPTKRDGLAKSAKHYTSLLKHEQLEILHKEKITYQDALIKAVKKYPYSLETYRMAYPELSIKKESVPFVPSSLTYADLFGVNQNTTDIADAFWDYLGRSTKNDQRFEPFIKQHFSEFFKASKKDLVEEHPKMDKLFNKVTNSTSLIIPLIPSKSLADAGLEDYQDTMEESKYYTVRTIADVFPEHLREQARLNGIAVLVNGNSETRDISKSQHYALKPFIMDELTNPTNKKRIDEAIKHIKYYVVVQTTYADYIKGIAKFTRNSGLNKYSETQVFSRLEKELEQYNDALLSLISELSQALDNVDDQLELNSVINQAFPMISLECKDYDHKPVDELAKIIEDRYSHYNAIDVFEIINTIAEGAPDYE